MAWACAAPKGDQPGLPETSPLNFNLSFPAVHITLHLVRQSCMYCCGAGAGGAPGSYHPAITKPKPQAPHRISVRPFLCSPCRLCARKRWRSAPQCGRGGGCLASAPESPQVAPSARQSYPSIAPTPARPAHPPPGVAETIGFAAAATAAAWHSLWGIGTLLQTGKRLLTGWQAKGDQSGRIDCGGPKHTVVFQRVRPEAS